MNLLFINMIRRQKLIIILSLILILFLRFSYVKKPMNPKRIIRKIREPIIFSKSNYLHQIRQPSENVICFLVASSIGEPHLAFNSYPRLREKISQLDERLSDGNVTDVIVFHTGYPYRKDLLSIIESSQRNIEFVNIDQIFYRFSPGFTPHARDPYWTMKGKWNYQHMCYFWFKQVFQLKIMQRYRYMMRLDDDSQLKSIWPNVFDLMKQHQAIYMANQREVDYEYVLPGLMMIRNITREHIIQKNRTIRNPVMFADVFNHSIEMPNYWNNFEIIELAFTRRPEVLDFIKAVDDSRGIFLYRWGDATLRYVTLALFVNETQILHREKLGLFYCHPC